MKNFFLEGDKFIGKSTLLQETIRMTNRSVSGFYVKRRMNSEGQIVGFELRAAREWFQKNTEQAIISDHCFIENKNGRRIRNLNVFELFGKSILEEAKIRTTDVILFDEIGGIELLAKTFTSELLTLIQQPRKIVGVFKSEANYQQQKQQMTEKLSIDKQRILLKQEILKNDGQILTLTEHNHSKIKKLLLEFLEK